MPNANASISYICMRWIFRQFEKEIFCKTSMETCVLAFTGHMAYVKSNVIILQCTITSKKHFLHSLRVICLGTEHVLSALKGVLQKGSSAPAWLSSQGLGFRLQPRVWVPCLPRWHVDYACSFSWERGIALSLSLFAARCKQFLIYSVST